MRQNISVIITNPNHHWQMIQPVIRRLREQYDVSVKIISLCEFRRMKTPVAELEAEAIPYATIKTLSRYGIRKENESRIIGTSASIKRRLLKQVMWYLIIRPFILKEARGFDKFILFNDAAFPGYHISKLLQSKGKHISLIQEGIRFKLPKEDILDEYGASGVDIIYSWGEKSADFFRERTMGKTKVIAAGCPRLDTLVNMDWSAQIADLRNNYEFADRNWLICSNPIDAQGYVTEDQKWELLGRYIKMVNPILQEEGIRLWIKLHPGENEHNLNHFLVQNGLDDAILLIKGGIFPILSIVDHVVILASTVGLEALCLGKQISVIDIPGFGCQFDYIEENTGTAIDLDDSNVEQSIRQIIDEEDNANNRAIYLDKHLSNRSNSDLFFAEKIQEG